MLLPFPLHHKISSEVIILVCRYPAKRETHLLFREDHGRIAENQEEENCEPHYWKIWIAKQETEIEEAFYERRGTEENLEEFSRKSSGISSKTYPVKDSIDPYLILYLK